MRDRPAKRSEAKLEKGREDLAGRASGCLAFSLSLRARSITSHVLPAPDSARMSTRYRAFKAGQRRGVPPVSWLRNSPITPFWGGWDKSTDEGNDLIFHVLDPALGG